VLYSAVVQKYLLEKSRIVSQGRNERNYHVFYYLLAGASEQEKQLLHLESCDRYNYLNKSGCYGLENIDERHEFSRLKQSMEMVGFTAEKQRRLFAVLSAVLLLGNYRIARIACATEITLILSIQVTLSFNRESRITITTKPWALKIQKWWH